MREDRIECLPEWIVISDEIHSGTHIYLRKRPEMAGKNPPILIKLIIHYKQKMQGGRGLKPSKIRTNVNLRK